jgi:hypothetical protein
MGLFEEDPHVILALLEPLGAEFAALKGWFVLLLAHGSGATSSAITGKCDAAAKFSIRFSHF